MNNPDKNTSQPKDREDTIHADIADKNKKDPDLVNGFKTGNDKQGRYHDKPFDEQMYGSFAEQREQSGEGESTAETNQEPE